MHFIVTLTRDEDGVFIAECPVLPGCISQGSTEDEAVSSIRDAITACLEVRAALGMPAPAAIRQIEIDVTPWNQCD